MKTPWLPRDTPVSWRRVGRIEIRWLPGDEATIGITRLDDQARQQLLAWAAELTPERWPFAAGAHGQAPRWRLPEDRPAVALLVLMMTEATSGEQILTPDMVAVCQEMSFTSFRLRDVAMMATALIKATTGTHDAPKEPVGKVAGLILERLQQLPTHRAMNTSELLDWLAEAPREIIIDESTLRKHLRQLEPYGLVHKARIGFFLR